MELELKALKKVETLVLEGAKRKVAGESLAEVLREVRRVLEGVKAKDV